jgi:hypothetical protein
MESWTWVFNVQAVWYSPSKALIIAPDQIICYLSNNWIYTHLLILYINNFYYKLIYIYILNLISLKNVTWHLTFRSINRWTLGRMVISTAREKTPIKIPLWTSRVSESCYFPKLGTQQQHGGERIRTL